MLCLRVFMCAFIRVLVSYHEHTPYSKTYAPDYGKIVHAYASVRTLFTCATFNHFHLRKYQFIKRLCAYADAEQHIVDRTGNKSTRNVGKIFEDEIKLFKIFQNLHFNAFKQAFFIN